MDKFLRVLKILVVEDSAERVELFLHVYGAHDLVIVDCVDDALRELRGQQFDLISLDFDLVDRRTGAEVAKYLAAEESLSATVLVHSLNPEGVHAIRAELPAVIEFPITALDRHNPAYSRLVAELASGRRVNWSFALKGIR